MRFACSPRRRLPSVDFCGFFLSRNPRARLGRAIIRLKWTIAAPPSPISPAIPDFHPCHSRESGNPDDFSQDCRPKSGANSERQIPSPFMGEG